jgi:hypothetical protein
MKYFHRNLRRCLAFIMACVLGVSVMAAEDRPWLNFPGQNEPCQEKPGKGKRIVLIAADQEYRSEDALPMLAKVLATHHGFDCTVLFSVNEHNEVDPTRKIRWEDKMITHHIPGLEQLDQADLLILFSRLITAAGKPTRLAASSWKPIKITRFCAA